MTATAHDALQARVRGEIESLHEQIEGWVSGRVENGRSAFERDLSGRFSGTFINVQPLGKILTREVLVSEIASSHGANPDFRIRIAECVLRWVSPDERFVQATYLEHQTAAKNTVPSDNTRISTVLFGSPPSNDRLEWLHLHETAVAGSK